MAVETSEQRNAGGTEAQRRSDGAGSENSQPGSEASRGNVQPPNDGPDPDPIMREGAAPDGRKLVIEEESGSAAAETRGQA